MSSKSRPSSIKKKVLFGFRNWRYEAQHFTCLEQFNMVFCFKDFSDSRLHSRTQEAKVGYQKFRVSLGYSRAGEMAKCLLRKCEHYCLDPQNPRIGQVCVATSR